MLIVCLGPHPWPQSVLDLGLARQRARPCLGTSPCGESSPGPHRLRILCRISYQRNVVTVCRRVGCWEGRGCQRDLSPNPDPNLLPKKGQLSSVPTASSPFLLKLLNSHLLLCARHQAGCWGLSELYDLVQGIFANVVFTVVESIPRNGSSSHS